MISLYEIEPGKWVVPELVTSVTAEVTMWSGLLKDWFNVKIWCIGGDPVIVRYGNAKSTGAQTSEALQEHANAAAAEVVRWIDERRIEPLRIVSEISG